MLTEYSEKYHQYSAFYATIAYWYRIYYYSEKIWYPGISRL